MSQAFPPARLDWSTGQPVSADYGDVYFSRESGLDETRHVFIEHNQLPQRFAALEAEQLFSIGETGFGTGLNFLVAWQCFLQHAPTGARLSFVSTEKHPLTATDLVQAQAMWPELAAQAAALQQQYDAMAPGWHRFVLENGRVILTLLIGDVLETLPQLEARIDAWFLDGFAPAKNPEMWQPALFQQLARLSHRGTTLATFTSAGIVRRGLEDAGFGIEKVPGHGRKRDMTRGQLLHPPHAEWRAPWYALPQQAVSERSAVVIGAGIAGASVARSLANRGWQVTVLDRHPLPAQEASGNPQGVLYTKLSPHFTPLTQLVLSGYGYTLRTLSRLLPEDGVQWRRCGVLQLAGDAAEEKRQQGLAAAGLPARILRRVDAAEASAIAGVELAQGGLYFEQGGWLNPPSLVNRLLDHPNITLRLGDAVTELAQNPADGGWVAVGSDGPLAIGSIAVVATANDTMQFDPTYYLPVKRIRGQVTELAATADSQRLQTVLCGEGYIAPARQGRHCLGATFKFEYEDLAANDAEHAENLTMLAGMAPRLYQALGGNDIGPAQCLGRAALRCTSPDYLPMVGAVVDRDAFLDCYQALARDASLKLTAEAPLIRGLYVSTAHGSRGMVTAPLAGEIIASQLNGEPAPLPGSIMDAVNPSRFLVRDLIRQKHRD
ncbi:bifunctional tRNA (5-methylaminomethyl-2-thiouridine)(34)-methyltransferase MnmD/FAD-dependent 5-carboxymethylaminomethyl-2-thiouridine(34) oxidoreductase MnmC [Vogesella sp. LYT5W]|uniref:tRNA 5-methylaminomethyl-2-thiouridine biosynthesis bifunctional protein MnmC n=1 Tax=Vogesella margarita TaxID=2984199 RepID=A0ABT5ILZ7_9NEIS|nr:bifunctional tRNA (5-methylaminomethyl-2-thiouridine)(34)-methyltransferase MnmD/FAD-dependent 5-carboxymethylaminomethyl-2-thiouridine(34) oxidoreductase MnmC [Vogesella margarita]MDC7713552.1 bifunctional tRNA (5-methylaminomethyl-2-thiouridine)(34)-methyltransferase MnmD/FAD-dependent 5-carboxymethylaminomethyl-2-thiouridine(34) oxidoreductase MnmC [Vogesella margarita]